MNKELFQASLEAAKDKVAAIRKETSQVYVIYSDLHTDNVQAESAKQLLEALEAVCKGIRPDAVIDLGDNVSMLGRNHHITNEQLEIVLIDLFDGMKRAAGVPMLHINGNHDAVGTDFFKPDLWNRVVRGKYDDGLACGPADGGYCYVDADGDTRLVFLSLPSDSDLTGEYPRPLWEYGEKQLAWLRDEALNTDRTVLLFCHVPLYYQYHGAFGADDTPFRVWDGEKETVTPVIQLCGWIGDLDEAVTIIRDSGRVAACFSGHTHADSLWEPYERKEQDTNPLPCFQVVTRNPVSERPAADEAGVALDILVWDSTDKTIRMVRVGDGEDRTVPCAVK